MSTTSADGTWKITLTSPLGKEEGTLELHTHGDGRLDGTMHAPQGTKRLEDGRVSGEELSWTARISRPMPMKLRFSARVDGDRISGRVRYGMLGSASFDGRRA